MSQGRSGAEQRLVTPGMTIGSLSGMRVGSGAISQNDKIIATKLGWVRELNGTISVDPISSPYLPRSGDLVIATVAEVRNNLWFMDINGSFQGLLPMSLAPWKVEFGHARKHMDVGDCVLARVQEVDECHNVVLTMKGIGLRKFSQGSVIEVGVNLLDKLRGENDSVINSIRESSDCRIVLGQNGRIWVDGDENGTSWMRDAINMAVAEGHKEDFNNKLSELIRNGE